MFEKLREYLICFFNDLRSQPHKYITLLGGMCIMSSLGVLNTIGSLSPYYISYLRIYKEENSVRYSKTIYILTVQSMFVALAAIFSGILRNRFFISLKIISCLGGVLFTSSFFLSYFTVQESFELFLLSQGMLFGFGYGMIFIVPFQTTIKWFTTHKGLATAMLFIGAGLGSLFFNLVGTLYINPDNISPSVPFSPDRTDEKYFSSANMDLMDRIPKAFLLIGCVVTVLNVIGQLLMREKKDTQEEEDLVSIRDIEAVPSKSENGQSQALISIKQALKIRDVYLIALAFSFFKIGPTTFAVNYKSYGQEFISDDKFLNMIASSVAILNIFTRFFIGWLIDKLSFKATFKCLTLTSIILLLGVGVNHYLKIKIIYLFWTFFIVACECGMMIIMPIGLAARFGQKNVALVYGIVALIGIPGNLIESIVTVVIVNKFGYFVMFCVTSVFSSLAMLMIQMFNANNSTG